MHNLNVDLADQHFCLTQEINLHTYISDQEHVSSMKIGNVLVARRIGLISDHADRYTDSFCYVHHE